MSTDTATVRGAVIDAVRGRTDGIRHEDLLVKVAVIEDVTCNDVTGPLRELERRGEIYDASTADEKPLWKPTTPL